ncbi:hypothetical protein FD33_GL000609 [Companilactobacillus paralimentarius DSM 13238 = JCM 10415]|uniref:Uncharacterized protein n=1 Tax=Companilactobacillus paralimentarius DSM 13238 = JCM 10415 TaxID=1122151 RepID=A0A0R1PB42_9LACO|nr:hypothetical protein [Companilactobacillus paralimentarius]KAE9565660.1 hypothetical protein ATN96_02315 [Companilactobacillus paralimentarius]KRL29697.1 hypothetical protein FD33_GL000609 [Companilactobacillus paralimentarius DSM 13238 = JCM 10415]MDR4934060.1 hypothetical protein [Companilactobacillus paralimentarius]QFR70452.1 hypothetical protein LP238_12565 [Companilactobacillus paralimentarius]
MDTELVKLTYDQIVALHLQIESGDEIVFSEKRLKSNLEFLNQFKDLELYATHLICTMICDDIFEKYNQQTALVALDFFLRQNGHELDLDNESERNQLLELMKKIKEADQLKKDDLEEIRLVLSSCIHTSTNE